MTTNIKKRDVPEKFVIRLFSHWLFLNLAIDIFGGFLITLLQKPGTGISIAIGFTAAGYISGIAGGFLYLYEKKYKKPATVHNYVLGIAVAAILAILFALFLSLVIPFILTFVFYWILPGILVSFLMTWTIRLLLKKKAKWWVWTLASLGLLVVALALGIFAIGSAVQLPLL